MVHSGWGCEDCGHVSPSVKAIPAECRDYPSFGVTWDEDRQSYEFDGRELMGDES